MHPKTPLWAKLIYTLVMALVLPYYWVNYGPVNFLWFSDISFFLMGVALWLESPLIASMMAVGVFPLEILWLLDFASFGVLGGITDYMHDQSLPLYLRALSSFHFFIPPAIIYMILKYGYDRRAFLYQLVLVWCVVPLTYYFADPAVDNINWVFGIGGQQTLMSPDVYVALYMVVFPLVVMVPMHLLLKRYFARAR